MIQDTRRAPRRHAAALLPVTDLIAEAPIGRVGNVSEHGMLLLASQPLVDDALYQLSFPLPDRADPEAAIDVGVHLLWQAPAHAPGQTWAGFRFVAVSDAHRARLRAWVAEDRRD